MTFLKQARLAAGLTQEELAKRAGVSQPTISALENAVQRMSPRVAEEMVWALKVSTSWAELREIHDRDVLQRYAALIDKALKGRITDHESFAAAIKDAGFRRVFQQAVLSAVESGEPRAVEFAAKAVEAAAGADFATRSRRDEHGSGHDVLGRPRHDRDELVKASKRCRPERDAFGLHRERDRDASFERHAAKAADIEYEFDHFGRRRPVKQPSTPHGPPAPRTGEEHDAAQARIAAQQAEAEAKRKEKEAEERRKAEARHARQNLVPGVNFTPTSALKSTPTISLDAAEKLLDQARTRTLTIPECWMALKAAIESGEIDRSDPAVSEIAGELMARSEKGDVSRA